MGINHIVVLYVFDILIVDTPVY